LRVALNENQSAEEEALQLIAFSADGSMRDAWSLMDMCLNDEGDLTELSVREALGSVDRSFLFQFVTALHDKNPQTAFRMIQDMHSSGKDVQVFLKDLTSHLRLLISAKLSGNKDKTDRYSQQAVGVTLDSLTLMLEKAVRAEGDLRWVSQPRALLEVYALSVCGSTVKTSSSALDSALSDRIEELENKLKSIKPADKAEAIFSAPQIPAVNSKADVLVRERQQPEDIHEYKKKIKSVQNDSIKADEIGTIPEIIATKELHQKKSENILQDKTDDLLISPPPDMRELSPKQIWNAMLERIGKEFPNIYGIMSEGRFGGFKDDKFFLNLAENQQLFIGLLMADERREAIENILTELAGKQVFFEAVRENNIVGKIDAKKKAEQDIQALSDLFGRKNIIVTGQDE
ncbi:MAG: hypothetical protein GX781_09395, partial [Clostridiales bacterium]|nr:hypothetical protein [Clostridiales bacterium]